MPISMRERGEKLKQQIAEDDQKSREKDAKFIRDPGGWPKWPVCPLKLRKGRFGEPGYCGFLMAVETPPYTVYLGLMYALKPGPMSEATKGMAIEEYGNLEALLDKWTVD